MFKICSRCKENKSTDDYTVSKTHALGIRPECRDCARRWRIIRGITALPEKLSAEYKRCSKCKKALLKTNFRRDKTKKDGYYPSCNDCQRKRTGARKITKGGLDSAGYKHAGRERLHRKIMENVLGRKLDRKEVVHHLNHDKLDNRPENLAVISASAHALLHFKEREEQFRQKKLLLSSV